MSDEVDVTENSLEAEENPLQDEGDGGFEKDRIEENGGEVFGDGQDDIDGAGGGAPQDFEENNNVDNGEEEDNGSVIDDGIDKDATSESVAIMENGDDERELTDDVEDRGDREDVGVDADGDEYDENFNGKSMESNANVDEEDRNASNDFGDDDGEDDALDDEQETGLGRAHIPQKPGSRPATREELEPDYAALAGFDEEAYEREFGDNSDEGDDVGDDIDAMANADDSFYEEDDVADASRDLRDAKAEMDLLQEQNIELQRKILGLWERDKRSKHSQAADLLSAKNSQNVGQIRQQYEKTLETLSTLWERLNSKREEAEEKIDMLTTRLDAQDEKATVLSDAFKSFKRDIAREARNSRTGKAILPKRLLAFEAAEEAKDRELAEVRLKHIHLQNQLKQLSDDVKRKEELAEGLHLIDFEQLKIENQTLNEKIEERNDELHKLKKKATTTLQVHTHIKQKLQFVQQELEILSEEKSSLDGGVNSLRDRLTKAKHVRDALRSENVVLKEKQGFIGSDLLVADYENRKSSLEEARAKVDFLKNRYQKFCAIIEQAKRAKEQVAEQRGIRLVNR